MDIQFKKILFKTAFCCMACDGHIDQKEIEEIKKMNSNTTYFGNVDLSDELESLIEDLQKNGKKVVNDLFQQLRETKLNPIQELLLLEVSLRVIYADDRVDENEIKFLNLLRGRLDVFDEIIIDRFGKDNLLFNNSYSSDVMVSEKDFIKGIKLPDLEILIDKSHFNN